MLIIFLFVALVWRVEWYVVYFIVAFFLNLLLLPERVKEFTVLYRATLLLLVLLICLNSIYGLMISRRALGSRGRQDDFEHQLLTAVPPGASVLISSIPSPYFEF